MDCYLASRRTLCFVVIAALFGNLPSIAKSEITSLPGKQILLEKFATIYDTGMDISADGSVVVDNSYITEFKRSQETTTSHAVVWKVKRRGSHSTGFPPAVAAPPVNDDFPLYDHGGPLYPLTTNRTLAYPSQVAGTLLKDRNTELGYDDSRVIIIEGGILTKPEEASSVPSEPGYDDSKVIIIEGGILTKPEEASSVPSEPGAGDNTQTNNSIFDVTMVNATNSRETFVKMAEKDNALHDLYRSNLQSLGTDHCALENKTYCIGAFGTANRLYHGGHEVNTGIHGAVQLAPQWLAGVSLAYLADDNLPGGIESRDSHTPGVGAYLRYAQNPDATGLSVTASAAYQEQELAIRRTTARQTEPGSGDSEITGTRFALESAYGVELDEHTLLSSSLGLQQLQARRAGYLEERDAEFPAVYGRSGEKSTALQIGLGVDHDLTDSLSLHADAGTRIVLDRDRDPFMVQAKYLGGFVDNSDEKVDVMPYANAGVSVHWGADDASLARLRIGIAKSDYGEQDANIGFSYDYRF